MYELAQRKLQRFTSGHYISVPIAWVRQHQLERGDKLSLSVDEEGHLVVEPVKEGEAA